MTKLARTYGSTMHLININEAWKFPTSPLIDNFGIIIPFQNKSFGLEEFNFTSFYINKKVAYIPCFGSYHFFPRPYVDELMLIYRVEDNKFCNYATMYKVRQIIDNEIDSYREVINPQIDNIYFSNETKLFFNNDIENFKIKINNMLNASSIANNNVYNSFLVNVEYNEINILETPKYLTLNSFYASQWFNL